MNSVDQFGEPATKVFDESDAARHLDKAAGIEVASTPIAMLTLLFSSMAAMAVGCKPDPQLIADVALAAELATLWANYRSSVKTAEDEALVEMFLDHPEAMREIVRKKLEALCEPVEQDIVHDMAVRLRKQAEAIGDERTARMAAMIEDILGPRHDRDDESDDDDRYAEEEEPLADEVDEVPHTPFPADMFEQRLKFEEQTKTAIRAETDMSVLRGPLRESIIWAYNKNEGLRPVLRQYYAGAKHLKPFFDEYYRHRAALQLLYNECLYTDSNIERDEVHFAFERRHAMGFDASGELSPDDFFLLQNEEKLARGRRDVFEHDHPHRNRSQRQQNHLDELDRHVETLEILLTKARGAVSDEAQETSAA